MTHSPSLCHDDTLIVSCVHQKTSIIFAPHQKNIQGLDIFLRIGGPQSEQVSVNVIFGNNLFSVLHAYIKIKERGVCHDTMTHPSSLCHDTLPPWQLPLSLGSLDECLAPLHSKPVSRIVSSSILYQK